MEPWAEYAYDGQPPRARISVTAAGTGFNPAPYLGIGFAEAEASVIRFWLEQARRGKVCIPMRQGAESLNVASAAAVLLYYQLFFAQNP